MDRDAVGEPAMSPASRCTPEFSRFLANQKPRLAGLPTPTLRAQQAPSGNSNQHFREQYGDARPIRTMHFRDGCDAMSADLHTAIDCCSPISLVVAVVRANADTHF